MRWQAGPSESVSLSFLPSNELNLIQFNSNLINNIPLSDDFWIYVLVCLVFKYVSVLCLLDKADASNIFQRKIGSGTAFVKQYDSHLGSEQFKRLNETHSLLGEMFLKAAWFIWETLAELQRETKPLGPQKLNLKVGAKYPCTWEHFRDVEDFITWLWTCTSLIKRDTGLLQFFIWYFMWLHFVDYSPLCLCDLGIILTCPW